MQKIIIVIYHNNPFFFFIILLFLTIPYTKQGMPYPKNVETAKQVENIIRDQGAIPATIAILNGKVHIGLEEEKLDELGRLGHQAVKASRRDLATVIAQKQAGATTVASTMILARRAGIPVFVTGGIGGVHRGADQCKKKKKKKK